MKPMLGVGTPLMHGPQPLPFPALQGFFDPLYPKGHQWYWRADFFRTLSDAAVDAHAEWGPRMPSGQSTMHLYPIDGAVHDVAAGDTPFSYRDVTFAEVIVGVDPDPANAAAITSLDEGLLGGDPPALGRRRLRQLHDGRGSGARARHLPGQLRPADPDQGGLRPRQPVPRQPEHPAGGLVLTVGGSGEGAHHLRVVRSGRMHVVLDDGSIVAVAAESQASLGWPGSRQRQIRARGRASGAGRASAGWCGGWAAGRGSRRTRVWTVAVSAAGVAPVA